jgi:hypothetical protein
MKKNKIPFHPQIALICTDGSTIQTDFVHYKNEFYIKPDIKSNSLWLPELDNAELEGLSSKSSKFKNYEFNFESLVLVENQDSTIKDNISNDYSTEVNSLDEDDYLFLEDFFYTYTYTYTYFYKY